MATATEILHGIGGFDGHARIFRMDPPLNGHDHVAVVVREAWDHNNQAEVVVYGCNDTGAVTNTFRQDGSYVAASPTHSNALMLAGYDIVQSGE